MNIKANPFWRPATRFATIGIGTIAGPGILFLLPFILPISQFADLAAMLAISQLIMSMGGFGLETSCPRLSVRLRLATIYSVTSIFIASAFVFIWFGGEANEKFILATLIAWAGALTAIFHSYVLFAGRAKFYGMVGLLKAVIFLAVLVIAIYFRATPVFAWFLAAVTSLCATLLIVVSNRGYVIESKPQGGWRDVMQISTPIAIIVAAGAVPFVLDRAIAQHVLCVQDFARYAVAVAWATPTLYVGNVAYQSIIATGKVIDKIALGYWCVVLLGLGILYILFVGVLVSTFVKVPYFEGGEDFFRLWGWIVSWYVIYTAISFPTAALVQKHFSATQLKSLAYVTAGVVVLWLLLAYGLQSYFSIGYGGNKTRTIILFTGCLAMVGVLPKIVFVARFFSQQKHSV